MEKNISQILDNGFIKSETTNVLKNLNLETPSDDNFYNYIKIILEKFSTKPLVSQKEILNELKVDKKELLKLNYIIQNSEEFQNLIIKNSPARKYWNTIIPFAALTDKVLKNEFSFPKRIAIFPGVSCMFYCGFCGRNQSAKYPTSILSDSSLAFDKLFNESPKDTAFSISGGLEPLTNPKIGEMISSAKKKGFKIPLITNGYSLTENFLNKTPGIWNLDSLRISLYGVDKESYHFITRVEKSFEMVKKNTINFLKKRSINNKDLKFGFNFIIIPENIEQLLKIPKLINEINHQTGEKNGVNFLTLRDDYQSVTGGEENLDTQRKYRLSKKIEKDERLRLIEVLKEFENLRSEYCSDLHVDYGYSLENLSRGIFDSGLIKNNGLQMRKFGFTQLSVAIDLYGDVFLYREAGFLNRQGNSKMIIGRISKEKSLAEVIKNFLDKKQPIIYDENDSRFMDSFDHVLTSLVNQAEEDENYDIPFIKGPIRERNLLKKMKLGNNWYSDEV